MPVSHAPTADASAACLHCGARYGVDASGFCCAGCRRVYETLQSSGLSRYYELRDEPGVPVGAPTERDTHWLEPIEARLEGAEGLERVQLDIQGVHCAACVWLVESLFNREEGGARCVVNPGRGTVELSVGPGFELRRFVAAVEDVGYRLGPPIKGAAKESDALTLRMGISIALAMNTMVLSLAVYFGLADGPLHTLARQVGFALCAATVLVGGSFFFKAAWASLKRGLLHLDLPIAIGIGLAFAGSAWSFFAGGGADFFDTLAVFVALMLVGRWVQERMLAKNRAQLLESDGVDGLYARRLDGRTPTLVKCTALEAGDRLLLSTGDLVPVDVTLEAPCQLRLDWINGESAPRAFAAGQVAPAGAFLASREAIRAECRTDLAGSPLVELLRAPSARDAGGPFWDALARFYVVGVLLAAAGAFTLWMRLGTVTEALAVTTAVLVVSCPCAFGIAAPLAQDLVQAALRRSGLFVRTAGLLTRATEVRRVVFDKTGTLTTGAPRLRDASPIDRLAPADRQALVDLAARSAHPKAQAVARVAGGEVTPDARVVEEPSSGLQLTRGGDLYRLGKPTWAAPERAHDADVDLVFARNGQPLAALSTEEDLRPDAAREVRALEAEGYEVFLLSGDAPAKVSALAARLGVPEERAIGGQTPESKAAWLRANDGAHALFVGDGINDSLAADAALVSGTPAIDRPFMAARSDFYFVTPGIAPIRRMLAWARRLRAVVRGDLAFAVAYNLGAVALAYAGLVEPWVAAVLMPISSVLTIAATTLALAGIERRRSSWRS